MGATPSAELISTLRSRGRARRAPGDKDTDTLTRSRMARDYLQIYCLRPRLGLVHRRTMEPLPRLIR